MRIIHIIPSLKIGGAEKLVIYICNEIFSKKEHEIKLITFKSSIHHFHKTPSYLVP